MKTAKPLLMQSVALKFIYVTFPIGQNLLLTQKIRISSCFFQKKGCYFL